MYKDFKRYKTRDFTGSEITNYCRYSDDLLIYGVFAVGNIPYFVFEFHTVAYNSDDLKSEYINGWKIADIKISEDKPYNINIAFDNGKKLEFSCKAIYLSLEKYKNKSYRNVYIEWLEYLKKVAYAESAEYFMGEENIELSEGYSLNVKLYTDSNEHAIKAELNICELTRNEEHIYSYRCTYNHPCFCKGFIYHSNGHRYLPFQLDLYGISYLDVDSKEVYNYIPEGYSHDIDIYCGESFIITDIHYDPRSNLIAYGGCYWAGPYEVMVGDFSDPMNYNPHLVSVNSIVDPDGEEGYDFDFSRFENDRLIVANEKREFSVDISVIFEKIREADREENN